MDEILVEYIEKYINTELIKVYDSAYVNFPHSDKYTFYKATDIENLKYHILYAGLHDLKVEINQILIDKNYVVILDYDYYNDRNTEYILKLSIQDKNLLLKDLIKIYNTERDKLIQSDHISIDFELDYVIDPLFLIKNGCVPNLDESEHTFIYGKNLSMNIKEFMYQIYEDYLLNKYSDLDLKFWYGLDIEEFNEYIKYTRNWKMCTLEYHRKHAIENGHSFYLFVLNQTNLLWDSNRPKTDMLIYKQLDIITNSNYIKVSRYSSGMSKGLYYVEDSRQKCNYCGTFYY